MKLPLLEMFQLGSQEHSLHNQLDVWTFSFLLGQIFKREEIHQKIHAEQMFFIAYFGGGIFIASSLDPIILPVEM